MRECPHHRVTLILKWIWVTRGVGKRTHRERWYYFECPISGCGYQRSYKYQ